MRSTTARRCAWRNSPSRRALADSSSRARAASTAPPATTSSTNAPRPTRVTAYGESKVLVERNVRPPADARFTPTFLRNATAYGVSPRLRGDLVVNNLVGYAFVQAKY